MDKKLKTAVLKCPKIKTNNSRSNFSETLHNMKARLRHQCSWRGIFSSLIGQKKKKPTWYWFCILAWTWSKRCLTTGMGVKHKKKEALRKKTLGASDVHTLKRSPCSVCSRKKNMDLVLWVAEQTKIIPRSGSSKSFWNQGEKKKKIK